MKIISRSGISALTAQTLGQELESSSRPIFTVFNTMEEVCYTPAFKQFGMQMILFAREESNLYQLLFMQGDGTSHSLDEVFSGLGESAGVCMEILNRDYGLSKPEAKTLFRHTWICTYVIAPLCATGMCRFNEDEINDLLGQDFMAMLIRIKSGGINKPISRPAQND